MNIDDVYIAVGCFIYIFTFWLLPLIVGYESTFVKYLILIAAVGAEIHFKKLWQLWPHLPPPREFEAQDNVKLYLPRPQYPLVVEYTQERLSEMFALREKLLAKEQETEWGTKIRGISIGSYWVETILSVLFFQEVYNNRTVRASIFKFLAYILPVMFLFQVIGLVGPTITTMNERFMILLQSDLIVRVVRKVGALFGYVMPDFIGTVLNNVVRVFGIWHPLLSFPLLFILRPSSCSRWDKPDNNQQQF